MHALRALVCVALFACCAVAAAGEQRRVFIAGDSTASAYDPERAPRTGWGQVLQTFLDPAAFDVRNHAQSGRSARSFIEQGWLDGIAKELRAGDVLLIQFGHNDEKIEDPTRYNEPHEAFPSWLMRYVSLARERGATPLLVTPLARRIFDHGQLLDTHGVYGDAVRALASREKVALIDLQARSMDWLRALGEEASKAFYMHVPDQGLADDTHLQMHGAVTVACLVVDAWKDVDDTLAPRVVRDTDCGALPTARADRAAQGAPSAVVHERDLAAMQPGPHGGAGETTAYPLFKDAGLPFALRKRVLHVGAGIGLHQHVKDEVYYIVSGRGSYVLDGVVHDVGAGDALLTRPGSTHAIRQVGEEDLVILLAYPLASDTEAH